MKKTLAIILALALVFSSFTVAFAEETLPAAAQSAKTLGMIVGGGDGVTLDYLKTTPDRTQAAAMFLRLKGLYDTAMAFTGTDNFADANQSTWAKPMMAYLKANPQLGFEGVGSNNFNPTGKMDAKSYYKVMLTALGYKQTVGTAVVGDFTWENLSTFAAGLNLKAVAGVTNFTVSDLATATIETLKTNAKGATKTLAASLVEAKVITEANAKAAGVLVDVVLAVDTVTVSTAKSFDVKFNKAVADTTKVTFAVTRGTVAATVTTTWNADKTVATLAAAAKLPEAAYTVLVKNDGVELAKKEVTISKEVVKNIEYTADKILRTNNHEGIVNFKIFNQYGENVTNLALGRGISFISSTSISNPKVDYKAGTILIQHGIATDVYQLKDMKTVTLTARDTTTGFVQTNVLSVSETVGVVADVKLLGIVNENGDKVDFKFDVAKTYYLDYEATDVLGNKITNITALSAVLYGQKVLNIQSSNSSLLTITPGAHPKDSTKLAFRIQLIAPTAPTYDTPVTFLAIAPYAGKNSNLTVTLLRKAAVDTFRMQNPAETVSQNKAIEIPFEAFDQAGNAITSYDDLSGKIQFSIPEVRLVRQANGTAKLFGTFGTKQTYYITSTVTGSLTGSFSQIAIDVKETAVATTIEPLRHTKGYMTGSTWYENNLRVNSFTVRDQFDNVMNLRAAANGNGYAIRVTSSAPTVVRVIPVLSTTPGVSATNIATDAIVQITGDQRVEFTGGATVGTATITYELLDIDANNDGTVGDYAADAVDTASTIAYNFAKSDIKSIAYTAATDAIYMATADAVGAQLVARDELYNDGEVVGKTDSGMDVLLPQDADLWFTTTNNKFIVDTEADVHAVGVFGTNEHTASSVVTANFQGANGVLTASAVITASDAAPVVDSISANYSSKERRNGNMTLNNDVVEFVSASWFNTNVVGRDLYYYGKDGTAASAAAVYFTANTSYGTWVVDNVIITRTQGTGTVNVVPNSNKATVIGAAVSGDQYTVTALSNNGKTKVVTFRIK